MERSITNTFFVHLAKQKTNKMAIQSQDVSRHDLDRYV